MAESYVPYGVPVDVDKWIVERAERLADKRGVKRVPKVAVLREMVAAQILVDSLGIEVPEQVQAQP